MNREELIKYLKEIDNVTVEILENFNKTLEIKYEFDKIARDLELKKREDFSEEELQLMDKIDETLNELYEMLIRDMY